MATLSYKVHVLDKNDTNHNTDSNAYLLTCYTTEAEAKPVSHNGTAISGSVWELKNNNTLCYVGLIPTNDAYITYKSPLVIKKSNVAYYAQTQTVNSYSVTIKGTTNQTISFVTGGVTTTVTTSDKIVYVNSGASYTCTVTANTGYTKGTLSGASASGYVTSNMTISASAATINSYVMTVIVPTGATITVGGTTYTAGTSTVSYDYLTQVTISYASTNSAQYSISNLKAGGTAFTSGNKYTMPPNATTVTCDAALRYYTISKTQGTGTALTIKNGSAEVENGSSIAYGTSLSYSASANTGYESANVTVGG